jgi:membrane-bound metal-dependent hydrolase YbcI (DUF457 family)
VPSPIGHVVAGIAAGWLVKGRPTSGVRATPAGVPTAAKRELALFAVLGALPDIDLVFGAHSGPTHSIGAAILVGFVAWVVGPRRVGLPAGGPIVFGVACAAAYGSHVLLDWLSTDASPPIGVMALWPFGRNHYESDLHVFMAISRRYYHGWPFVHQNLLAILRELAILVPVLAIIAFTRRLCHQE